MDNQELDRFFSERLKATQSFDFREEDWEAVADRLDNHDSRRRGGIWWWAGMGGALLFLVLAWLSYSLYQTRQKVWLLEQQANQPTAAVDTVYKEIIVERIDTVYQTINSNPQNQSRQSVTNQAAPDRTSQPNPATPLTKNGIEVKSNFPNVPVLKEKVLKATSASPIAPDSLKTNLPIATNATPYPNATTSTTATALLPNYPLWLPEASLKIDPLPPSDGSSPSKLIQPVKKEKRFQLGLEANYAFVPAASLEGQLGYGFGLIGLYTINKCWDVFVRLSRQQFRYSANTSNFDRLGIPSLSYLDRIISTDQEDGLFDPTANSSTTYTFNGGDGNNEVNKSFIQYEIGASYRFAGRFYAALSWSALSQIDQKFGVFERSSGENTSLRSDGTSVKRWRWYRVGAQLGAKFDLGKSWQLRPEVFYYHSFDNNQDRIPSSLGLRTTILYAF
ncbi:MAG: hypothetical protein AAFP19_04070 [Bacteroidota bacterium]